MQQEDKNATQDTETLRELQSYYDKKLEKKQNQIQDLEGYIRDFRVETATASEATTTLTKQLEEKDIKIEELNSNIKWAQGYTKLVENNLNMAHTQNLELLDCNRQLQRELQTMK